MKTVNSRPAESKAPLAPDPCQLSDRARRAWTEAMAVRRAGEEYVVTGESDRTYLVDPEAGTCGCPDYRLRGETCKHLRRVALEITSRRVPPPGQKRERCSRCGREIFLPRDQEGPGRCRDCRLERGDVVRDVEDDQRLVVVSVTDEPADEVTIPAVGTTVAGYPTNDAYPGTDTVVYAAYLRDVARHENPTTYAFPRSRLRRADETG